jgi:hypothetical protein
VPPGRAVRLELYIGPQVILPEVLFGVLPHPFFEAVKHLLRADIYRCCRCHWYRFINIDPEAAIILPYGVAGQHLRTAAQGQQHGGVSQVGRMAHILDIQPLPPCIPVRKNSDYRILPQQSQAWSDPTVYGDGGDGHTFAQRVHRSRYAQHA